MFCFFSDDLRAQGNLVPNPSFEDTLRCPTSINQSLTTVSWSSYGGTSDYFNTCALPPPSSVGVPKNIFGYQVPATGNAYCGLITFMKEGTNVREHIGAELITPLVKGTKYYVSFKTVMAVGGAFSVNIAANNIGIKFLMQPLPAFNNGPVFNSAHIFATSVITDSTNWTTVSGSFVADTNYKYIACGNFFNDAATSTVSIDSPEEQAYYFVDDIRVSVDSLEEVVTELVHEAPAKNVRIYPNPATKFVLVDTDDETGPSEVKIVNLMGELLLRRTVSGGPGKVDLNGIAPGVYYVNIVSGNTERFFKLLIED